MTVQDAKSDSSESSDDGNSCYRDRVADVAGRPRGGDSTRTFVRASSKKNVHQKSMEELDGPKDAATQQTQLPTNEESGVGGTHKRLMYQSPTVADDVFEGAGPPVRSIFLQSAPQTENDRGWKGLSNDMEMEQESLRTPAPTEDLPIEQAALVDIDMKQPSLPSPPPSPSKAALNHNATSWLRTRQPSAQPRSYQRNQPPVYVFQASPTLAVPIRKPRKPQNHTFQISSTIHCYGSATTLHPSIHAPARQLSKVRNYIEMANATWLRQYQMALRQYGIVAFFDLRALFVSWDIGAKATQSEIFRPIEYAKFFKKVKDQPPNTRFRVMLHFEHIDPEESVGIGKRRVLNDGKDQADPDCFRAVA